MLKDLLARFKKVSTVAEYFEEARRAMIDKEFVIESLNELHRVEKAEALAGQDMVMSRQQGAYGYGMAQGQYQQAPNGYPYAMPMGVNHDKENEKRKAQMSLAELMNSIRQQQATN